jgi:Ca-activated chloride channel homolog
MNLAEFHFIRPYGLLALLPYAALLFWLIRQKLKQGNWTALCDAALLPFLLETQAIKQRRWPLWCGATGGLLAIVALAGPTWERLPAPVFRNDSALVIVLDLSRSMAAADVKPSRLVMARYKISDILKQRKDGQTALVAYSDDAFTVTPLTTDTETIDNQLSALGPEIMPADGNNPAKAIANAKQLLRQAGLQKGRILLISDGGGLDAAESETKNRGNYTLSVLAVGSADGAPIALPEGGFLKDDKGDIVVDKVDTGALARLAEAGGGAFSALTQDDSDLRTLLFSIEDHADGKIKDNDQQVYLEQWNDKGPWLLLLALPLVALFFRRGLLAFAVFAILPLPKPAHALDLNWQDWWQTKDQQAQEAYRKGDYGRAADLFNNPEWKAAAEYQNGAYDKVLENLKNENEADSLYNKGNALAQSGQLQQALEAYNKALKLRPQDSDTLYNKDLVEKELEKQKQEQNKEKQNQQNPDQQNDKNQQEKQNDQNGDKQNQDQKSDKEEQSGQQEQDSQNKDKDGQDASEQKPEQKPEQSQQDLERQTEEKKAEEDQQKQQQAAKPEPQPEKKDENKPDEKGNPKEQAVPVEQSKEEQQATEQWLKRIPDDPAGLLRRKFKYQYDRRGQY